MAEIKLKSEQSGKAVAILRDAMKIEEMRLTHALDIGQRRMTAFEKKFCSPHLFKKKSPSFLALRL